MQLRSGRRHGPARPPAPGGQRRHGRPPRCPEAAGGGGVEEDRISSLPDDLILAVLVRLGCVEEAALTSVLARRWRGLWTQLPELVFVDWTCLKLRSIEAALAQVTRPALDSLCIALELDGEAGGRVSSLLRDVGERLSPKEVSIFLQGMVEGEDINLPCFRTTTYLDLCQNGVDLALPPPGSKFEALTQLVLDAWTISFADLIPMCPSLRHLDVTDLMFGEVTVHSTSLEKLNVTSAKGEDGLWLFDISAPLLKEASFDIKAVPDLSVSFAAPMVKKFSWSCEFDFEDDDIDAVGLPCMRLSSLDYSMRRGVRQLCLRIVYLASSNEAGDFTSKRGGERSSAQDYQVLGKMWV
ncbi:hypothetical protein C2845_PM05G22610 [Panicum miliaceum]|uniref:F-box domain-containing protein n=1 Tax=Panicum miliaceum TaxID=4540 RepID=A0A3L6T2T2_PANMI|nr:hypothetical protein C2845_PM05G22610 [Panicum miliaceum]